MVALVGSPLAAQMRGGGLPSLTSIGRGAPRPGFFPGGHPRAPSMVYLGTPFWGDDWPSYAGAPPVVVVQSQAAPAPPRPRVTEERPIVPVLIELEGDQYVRRSSGEKAKSESARVSVAPAAESRATESRNPTVAPKTASLVPAAVFVFRDGHRGESSDYAIVSGVIYARGNYWTTGEWTQSIKISDLDLPATLKANQERGVPFRLPQAPNEVITRF